MQVAEANAALAKVREIARGRKDKQGQEKIIDLTALGEGLSNLCELKVKAKNSNNVYGDAVKAVAESSGLLASVVRKIVAAKTSEMYIERKKEAQQLALVFDELSESGVKVKNQKTDD